MMRFLHIAAVTCLIGSAAYAYRIKYETLYYTEEASKLRSRVQNERDAIAVSKAEWSLLTRPDRLQRMVNQHLDLQQMSVGQLARISDLPVRPPKADEIGRKLEAILLQPAAAPTKFELRPDAKPPAAPAAPPAKSATLAPAPAKSADLARRVAPPAPKADPLRRKIESLFSGPTVTGSVKRPVFSPPDPAR